MKILLSDEKKQYRANLHCHSTRSDGKLSPEELVARYRARGYDILAITDHCSPKSHSALGDEKFLLLTGYEAYLRPSPDCVYDLYSPEIHLNLFAKRPDNEALICYNRAYTKYIPAEKHNELVRYGSEEPRQYTIEYINKFIRTAREAGYLVACNHPFWSMESEERLLALEGLFSLEIRNTGSYLLNRLENGEMLYDTMMRHGIQIACHAADDNHNSPAMDDSFRYFTMVLADSLTYDSVIGALEAKDFYASSGPLIHKIAVVTEEDGARKVQVECSPAEEIYMFVGSKKPERIALKKGESATSFTLSLPARAEYFRISIYDGDGEVANSRGFFRSEWE